MVTKNYLEALEVVVSRRYSRKMYSIGEYQEAAICLQSEKNGWIVYNGERGNRYCEVECDTVLRACLEFIRRFTHKTEDIASMENELISILCSKVA